MFDSHVDPVYGEKETYQMCLYKLFKLLLQHKIHFSAAACCKPEHSSQVGGSSVQEKLFRVKSESSLESLFLLECGIDLQTLWGE